MIILQSKDSNNNSLHSEENSSLTISIQDWLDALKLGHYTEKFLSRGYNNLQLVIDY